MNILSVDYGKKNIGLAWAQAGLDVVLPYGKITGDSEESKIKKIIQLIKEEKIDQVIFGLPIGTDGKENENTERVRNFVDKLKINLPNVKFDFFDERFSSKQADAMGAGVSRDEKAAMVILQSYLDKQ